MNKKLILLAVGAIVVLAGCKPNLPEVAFKRTNNTVYPRLQAEPDRLNPLVTTNAYSRMVHEQIFQSLLAFDPATLELSPMLAKARPTITPITAGPHAGGLAYHFELFAEATWDDGTPVTANDVIFTFKALFNPLVNSAAYRAYLEFVRDIVIDDPANPKRFTVITNQQYILGEAAISSMNVMPAAVYDPQGLLRDIPLSDLADPARAEQLANTDPRLQQFADAFNGNNYAREKGYISGSGPYQFETWETGQHILLTRKSKWWGQNLADKYTLLKAYPDSIDYLIISDQTTVVNAIKDETVDVASQLDSRDFKEMSTNELVTSHYNLFTPTAMQYFFVALNTKDPLLSDKKVRRALAHLVDIDLVIANLYEGYAQRIVGPFHPSKSYYHQDLPLIAYNPTQAQTLLREAGWEDTNGNGVLDKQIDGQLRELELEYLVSSASKFGQDLALLMQGNAAQAGVKINIVAKDFTTLMQENLRTRRYQLYGGGFGADPLPDDPKQVWHTESDTPSGSNRVGFGNAQTDALIDEIRVTLDEKRRNELYRRFQEIVYDEQPMIFLFTPQDRIVISKRFDAEATVLRPGFFVNQFILQRDLVGQ